MNIVSNEKLIRRNALIGQVTSIVALVILGVGLYITFKMPELFNLSLIALLLGFFLTQIGLYFGNRWGRRPRPDEMIDKNLKGLGREYTIYHYTTPATHLLLGPAGIWSILPYHQSGTIAYEKGRFRQKGGGFVQNYLRIFGQENLGRPELEAKAEQDMLKGYLTRILPDVELPPLQAALFFYHPNAELKTGDAPLPVLSPRTFKDFMRQRSKEKPILENLLETLREALPKPVKEE